MIVSFASLRRAALRSAILWAALPVTWAPAAEAGHLYLLSGTPTNGQSLPVRLYSVDLASAGAVELVTEVAAGLTCVFPDYEKRVLVVASPDVRPTDLHVINMSTPAKPDIRHIAGDSADAGAVVASMFLLDIPGRGEGVAAALNKVTKQGAVEFPSSLVFVRLDSLQAQAAMPFDSIKYEKFSGFAGGAITTSQCEVALRGDPLRALLGAATALTGLRRPPYLRGRDPNDSYTLISSDDMRAVMRPLDPAEPGVIDVLDKTSGEWQRLPIPFPSARMRTFGHWLAAIESRAPANGAPAKGETTAMHRSEPEALKQSPGATKRRSEELAPGYRLEPATTVDDLFQMAQFRGEIFTGELLAYNLNTGAQLRISTNSGDSEIVFLNDQAIYYRVDDALYRREISGTSPGEAVRLAEGPEIFQVHWAFLK